MSKNEIALIPQYIASVSGGKDSLFMLKLILNNPEMYPLHGVVHFELDIDYPFIHNVIDYMQAECEKAGIPFYRIKPRNTWETLYNKYGFPTRKSRWCNSLYKMDSKRQLAEFMKSRGCRVVSYIGYCADETRRMKRKTRTPDEIYPIAEMGYNESVILEWAQTVPLFNDYYKYNKRCGCMYCPLSSRIAYAYLCKYYPEHYAYMIDKMKETEKKESAELGRKFCVIDGHGVYDAEYLDRNVREKWLPKLEEKG